MDRDAHLYTPKQISIHSLRMEGDCWEWEGIAYTRHFNPLPPYGGRPISAVNFPGEGVFQSTPSVWRETSRFLSQLSFPAHFNPLPPYGGRLFLIVIFFFLLVISIHSLRMEGDFIFSICVHHMRFHFNPLPPYGGRLV